MDIEPSRPGPQAVLHSLLPEKVAIAACCEILAAQQDRRRLLSAPLPTMPVERLMAEMERTSAESAPLVAYVENVPYACALPGLEAYGSGDDRLAYFRSPTGIARGLGIRDGSGKARAAFTSLAQGLADYWRRHGASGAKVLWPVSDVDISRELAGIGLAPDAYIEYRPHGDRLSHRHHDDLRLRAAGRDDLSDAVRLNSMILEEHVQVSPFARQVPGVDERFTERFLAATSGASPAHRMVFVAEFRGRVVGLAECEVERHDATLDATFPTGTMGYIHAFGVDQPWQRKGIGTALAAMAVEQLQKRHASGIRLLASHYNHPARAFWNRVGFRQVWQLLQTHRL